MGKESVPDQIDQGERCPGCGYYPHKKDRAWIASQNVWHCICYQCNMEWVE